MGVEQREVLREGHQELLPEPFDGVVTHAVGQCIIDDADKFSIRKPVVKAFESLEFLDHGVRHPVTAPRWDDFDGVGEQTAHALLLKAALEGADRFRMGVRFFSPLDGGAIVEEDQRTDDCIASLNWVAEKFLQLVKIR
jgi:hypothetical protein